jgi:hypothetical protein
MQRDDPDALRVGRTRFGNGVFVTRAFEPEAMVASVSGKVIDDPDYTSDYCIDLGGSLSLEPAAPYRYLNHSCEPNCELVLLETDAGECEVVLEALRPIAAGEELFIDYAWPSDYAIPCGCGSVSCRGWIVSVDEVGDVPDPPRGRGPVDLVA